MTPSPAGRAVHFTLAASRYLSTHSEVLHRTHVGRLTASGGALALVGVALAKSRKSRWLLWALAAPLALLFRQLLLAAVTDKSSHRDFLDEQVERLQEWTLQRYSLILNPTSAALLLFGALRKTTPIVEAFDTKARRYLVQLTPTHSRSTYEFRLTAGGEPLPQLAEGANGGHA